ncbi:hypothetical protein BC827DRAFT_1158795 [Russula dissimulans]|nr:hypothetical protein BC827DRAFT_1158795 [Russula dissimulans]
MPFRDKKSRIAKQKRQNAQAAFAKQTSMPNPNSSDYYVSDSDSNKSVISVEEIGEVHEVDESVKALQTLYSVFLPPHLRLEENSQEKHQNVNNWKCVYTGDSWVMNWRKNKAWEHAAKGCMTLNAFITRKKWQHSPSPEAMEFARLTPDIKEIMPPSARLRLEAPQYSQQCNERVSRDACSNLC